MNTDDLRTAMGIARASPHGFRLDRNGCDWLERYADEIDRLRADDVRARQVIERRKAENERLRAALAESAACLEDVYPILGQIEWRLGVFEHVRVDLEDLPARTKAALARARAMQEGGES